MKKVKFTVGMALTLAVSLVGTSAVQGATTDVPVTATATVLAPAGTRVLSPITPVVLNNANGFSATFTVSAVEALANGVNSWSVSAISSNFTTTGTVIDASALAYARAASNAETQSVPASATAGAIQAGTSGPLNTSQTLFSVTGEVANTFPGYTGTYTSLGTVTLTIPSGKPAGVYTATVTVTMIA